MHPREQNFVDFKRFKAMGFTFRLHPIINPELNSGGLENLKINRLATGLPEELLPNVSPELWLLDWDLMKRPDHIEMQFELTVIIKITSKCFLSFKTIFALTNRQP